MGPSMFRLMSVIVWLMTFGLVKVTATFSRDGETHEGVGVH